MKNNNIPNIPAEKFRFVAEGERLHDQKLETKKVSYLGDAFRRFCRNKSSVVAAIIICCLVFYAIFVPIFCETTYSKALRDTNYLNYTKLAPKLPFADDLGLKFWNGTKELTLGEANRIYYEAIGVETGRPVVTEIKETKYNSEGKVSYVASVDSYVSNGFIYMTLTEEEYKDIQKWQVENNVQVIYPAVSDRKLTDANIWYKANKKGAAILDKEGNYQDIYRDKGNDGDYDSLRIDGDPGKEDPEAKDRYRYATITGDSTAISYRCRIFLNNYFHYKYGYEACFLFGTNGMGQDILTRLAAGARFSLLFAVCISVINLFIGTVYGAIEGYYGGAVDMLMERFSDILSRVPFMVVVTLFQLHLSKKVGPIPSLLFAFVLTGWIGTAGTVRMQFYRYKGQEYVLAARVLGASDRRIMFRHIFPNSLGTIITSSVLIIPGVIFSESSLTYLGIVNLDSSTTTSVGTMLANARSYLSSYPHIILFPAVFISLLEISFNLFGNGLRDAFNPSLRGADE
jgi:oligopeptide transport system permease protein